MSHAFTTGSRVSFQTFGRSGIAPARIGVVLEVYGSAKGEYVRIKGEDGKEYKTRPSKVTLAA
ncbi:hypothetical protein NON00_02415 [Roseomonas sp. GC11]|uniref:hypothetical protein n=1 Tax=Roseomonas sp. GC11 TaxID=2950546 RepID=UPI00210C650A|nr:hypothetical protein [Roseomonas sp. GC11]MCQ4158781.1 hypothetical protein [Roseomonas sp. GC11]